MLWDRVDTSVLMQKMHILSELPPFLGFIFLVEFKQKERRNEDERCLKKSLTNDIILLRMKETSVTFLEVVYKWPLLQFTIN